MKLNQKTLLIALLVTLLAGMGFQMLGLTRGSALSGSNFHAGRIIDDSIFFNPNSMSATDIQNFLNSKVPTCDTNGTQTSEFGGGTRAQYGTSKGYPPPYTCLKDYSQSIPSMAADAYCSGSVSGGTKSAAQIIKDVASACSVNPEVLLVLLQKEQGLVTDDWPWSIQYTAATGYGCPDTALSTTVDANQNGCYDAYEGFFKQVYYGARQYQQYAKQPQDYNYHANESDNIYYNPKSSCGYSSVYIENQSTAGLYNYTPYQPNNAALNDLYGSGDNVPGGAYCSSFGNRNFWRQFNDWFGPTTNDSSAWGTIWNNSNLYLVVGRTYYYVPGPAIEDAWGLANYTPINNDPNVDPAQYLASLTQGPNLGYVALDSNGTRYMMDGGKKYRLVDDSHVLAWGMAGEAAKGIYAVGLLGLTPSGGDAGRFGVSSTSGTAYLMDGTAKYAGQTAQSLGYWGYSAGTATTVTDDILNRLTTGSPIDRYINAGGSDSIVDSSKLLQFRNSDTENGWGSHTYLSIPSYAVNMLPAVSGVGTFVRADNDAKWYYLENGNIHYISSSKIANIWGWGNSNPLTVISSGLLSTFTLSGDLGYLAYSTGSGKHYVVDGYKHWLPNAAAAQAWEGGASAPGFSESSFNLLPAGANAGSDVVGFSGNPRIFALDYGQLRGIGSYNVLDAFGINRNNPVISYSSSLDGLITTSSNVDYVVKDNLNNTYFLDNGYSYKLSSSYLNTWQAAAPPVLNSATLSMLTDSGKSLEDGVSLNGRDYLMNGRTLVDVTDDYQNYGMATTDFAAIGHNYFPIFGSSHLVGTPGSNKIWLLSMGRRYYIPSFGLLMDLGFGSHSGIAVLNSDIMAGLPEDVSAAGRLIKSPNSGVVYVIGGQGYGFKDSDTLSAYSGSSSVLTEPASVFQKFWFSGWVSRIVYGTDGKLYYLSGGQKQWIANPSLLYTRYAGISWMYQPQYVIDSYPTGATITN